MSVREHIEKTEPRVFTFYTTALHYCELIDGLRIGTVKSPYTKLLASLSALSNAGLSLPFDMPDNDVEAPELSHEQWSVIAGEIANAIDPACQSLFATLAEDDTAGKSRVKMLWDDLADIYRDLQEGITLYERGDQESVSEAIWQWRFGYEHHWGYHLYSALLTVHEIHYRVYED